MGAVSGFVSVEGVAVPGRTVRLYNRATGALLGETASAAGGETYWSGDASFLNVSLLVHANGADGSTTLTDNSPNPKTITAVGDAKLKTDQFKFGTASMYFDGVGDAFTVPNSTDLDLGNNYTVEYWVRPAVAGNLGLMSIGEYQNPAAVWAGLVVSVRGQYGFVYFAGTTGANEQRLTGTNLATLVPAITWTHIAIVREGATGRLYINGVQNVTIASLATQAATSRMLSIGRWDYNVAPEYFQGHMDDLRISRDVRYPGGTTFTPPAAAMSDGVPMVMSAGQYTFNTSYSGEVQVVALDDASGMVYNDVIKRAAPA